MKENFSIGEIVDYIIKNYPQSCLAQNNKHDSDGFTSVSVNNPTLINSFDMIQECENFFYFEKLKWCGCGSPEIVKRVIMKYFSLLEWWHDERNDDMEFHKCYEERKRRCFEAFDVNDEYGNPLLLALAYSMDAAGFTEHGSSIGGAWLTNEGEMFLFLLRHDTEITEEG